MMYPEMRRKKQALDPAACGAILQAGTSGVLALSGADGQPYAVPLSYVYHAGKIYFHCAKAGRKLDLLDQNPRASFCVIGQDRVAPAKYTTLYRSVIVFGTVRHPGAGPPLRPRRASRGDRRRDRPLLGRAVYAGACPRPDHRQTVHRAGGAVIAP